MPSRAYKHALSGNRRSREHLLRNMKRAGKRGSPLPIRHMHAAAPFRTPNQTAKKSVTRTNDLTYKIEGNELAPDTQLEKRTWRICGESSVEVLNIASVDGETLKPKENHHETLRWN